MSKPSRRPNREELKQKRRERKKAELALRRRQANEGLVPFSKASASNGKCPYETIEQEQAAREDATLEQVRIFRAQLPIILKRLTKIPDPRNPKKTKHKLTALMLYGVLMFVFQMASRRQANEKMSRPSFMETLKNLFPELEDLPHHDTLMRLLARIDVSQIEATLLDLIGNLIRKKKFCRYLVDNHYRIAVDGTQKFARNVLWSEECLEREIRSGTETRMQYYVYVLEANLSFPCGMSIPLMSEFLSYSEGDTDREKQDCETKSFKRLATRLKEEFPRLPIMILLDGLYPNGPIVELCRKNHWDFMIVLPDKSLPSVWEEYEGLKKLEPKNNHKTTWGNRRQHFQWVNEIDYRYGPNERKKQILHVVVCEESWEEVAKDSNKTITITSRHAWISNKPLDKRNLHERCNLGGRHRWSIETGILVEKRHGYQYEHAFSYDWNAMKGYHYLMRLGHAINVLAQYSERLVKMVRQLGVRGFIDFVRDTIAGRWLEPQLVKERLAAPFQLRLI
jgi:hypothetical protein